MTPLQASALIRLTLQEHGSSDRGYVVEERSPVGEFLCWGVSFLTAIDYDTRVDPTLQDEPETDVGTRNILFKLDQDEQELENIVIDVIEEIEKTPIAINGIR